MLARRRRSGKQLSALLRDGLDERDRAERPVHSRSARDFRSPRAACRAQILSARADPQLARGSADVSAPPISTAIVGSEPDEPTLPRVRKATSPATCVRTWLAEPQTGGAPAPGSVTLRRVTRIRRMTEDDLGAVVAL
jgi:hypothetical protein